MERKRGGRWLLAGALAALGVAILTLGAGSHVANAEGGTPISIIDFAFEPELVGVPSGATVTWTNYGSAPHTVTADSSAFSSGQLAPGETYSQTFTTPGSFTYRCRIHPHMTGTIVVTTDAAQAATVGPEAVPVVGVGTGVAGQSSGLALLATLAALAFGSLAILTYRRA